MEIKGIFDKVKDMMSGTGSGWLKVVIISIAVFIAIRMLMKDKTVYVANDMVDDFVTVALANYMGTFGSDALELVGGLLPGALGLGNIVANAVLPFTDTTTVLTEQQTNTASLTIAVIMFISMAFLKDGAVGTKVIQRGVNNAYY